MEGRGKISDLASKRLLIVIHFTSCKPSSDQPYSEHLRAYGSVELKKLLTDVKPQTPIATCVYEVLASLDRR